MSKKLIIFLVLFLSLLSAVYFLLKGSTFNKAGNCIVFDGKSGYVLIPNKDSKFNNPHFTLEGWFYFEGLPKLSGIASVYSSTDNKRVWALIQKEGEQICFLTSENGISIIQASWNLSIPIEQWIYLGLAYSNGEAVLYVNGQGKGSRNAAEKLLLCDQELALGSFNNGSFLKGRMDEVRFWSKALGQEEVQRLMCSTVNGEEIDLIAAYSFDEDCLGTLYDKCGSFDGMHMNLTPESIIKSDAPVKSDYNKKKRDLKYPIISGVKPPEKFYVWFEGPSSIGLRWEKVEGADSYLIYCSEFDNGPFELVSEVNTPEFLDFNLRRNQEFYYKISCVVGSSKGKKSEALRAVTDNTLNDLAFKKIESCKVTYPYRFIVMGDSHVKTGNGNINDNSVNTIFKRHLKAMQNLYPRPLFMIITGDLTNNGFGEHYLTYSNLISSWMAETGISVFSLPGNHDLQSENGFEYYASFIGDMDYFFDFGNTRFVCVNNVQHAGDQSGWNNLNYRIDESQMTFL